MKEEIYQKAIEISHKINGLDEVKRKICSDGCLVVARKYRNSEGNDRYELYPEWQLSSIMDILNSHREQVISEINLKIKALKKEIDEL